MIVFSDGEYLTRESTLRDQLAAVARAAADTHGEHRRISDGTADIVCGCGEFRAVYAPDEEPGARGRAYAEHVAYATADAMLTALGAPEPPNAPPDREPNDDEWWGFLLHCTASERQNRMAVIRANMARAHTCFIRNHAALEEDALRWAALTRHTEIVYTIASRDPDTGELTHHHGGDDEYRLRDALRRHVGQVARYPATARLYRATRTYLASEPGPFTYEELP